MSTYALQTKTMHSSVPEKSGRILGLNAAREEPKPQLLSKRKRASLSDLGPWTTPFTIKPYPDSPYAKPATFEPVQLTSRCQLPLSFLDLTANEQLPPNGLFTARIDVLEIDGVKGKQEVAASKVLIARDETTRTLYAIERLRDRLYNICKLAPWLKEEELVQLWDPVTTSAFPVLPVHDAAHAHRELWWQHAMVEVDPVVRPVKRARISMVRRPIESVQIKLEPQQETLHSMIPAPVQLEGTVATEPLQEPVMETPTAQEQLGSLVQQYLDAVYTSKTSLAYFAKGPITRIRNAFTSPDESAPATHELVSFLRSMLLTPKAGEKKYYEKLPSIVKATPVGVISDEEATTKSNKARKSKKKMKISRDGVYPSEDEFVKKWWRSEMPNMESAGQETIETRVKRRIGDLRVRETLAQLILMLEIIALESLATYKAPPMDGLPRDESQIQDHAPPQSKKRKKKLDDVALQLDLLLDRLSIWHATEEAGILDFDMKAAKQQDMADGDGKRGSDRLHGFCVEVIVPFYMSRLPEQALSINKKLGGPAIASSKRKAMRPPLTSKKSGGSKEPESKKPRRSLARVATDTIGQTGNKRTPSLARSATDTALLRQQSIKREGSEAPLSAIPFRRSPSRARQSMSQLRHLQGREMDLTATSAAAAAKLKHKARVEDDLKEAIATLKKPNRDLAAGAYMAEIEQRGLGSANRSRKPANPVRKVVKDVQVTATPRVGRRTKNLVEQTPVRYHQNPFVRPTATEPAPLSDLCIPSSGVRHPSSILPGTIQRSATAREIAQPGIAETPSKAPTTKTFSSGAARRTIFATPVKSSTRLFPEDAHPTSNVFETPVKAARSPPSVHRHSPPPVIDATPIKEVVSNVDATPIMFATPAKLVEEASIYDALGWNDDDDDFA
ncbi:hypothetical protein OPT61_g6950 [Boeremia exigua]|uniref:Uncharacterized protein n=1 Tax=Boeremia exigua TaxID=749465 RepID=A0ACC2I433_9PLEO|nr:hypothetical protein OPT61_g6950 [Boeremia exigua]